MYDCIESGFFCEKEKKKRKKKENLIICIQLHRDARNVMVTIIENRHIRVQVMDNAVCISHSANIPRQGMNPAMGKKKGRLGFLTLVWQPV